jgi:hypothetical protein
VKTYEQFAKKHNITMTAERIAERTDLAGKEGWGNDRGARHWKLTLLRPASYKGERRKKASMTVLFSQGSAHTKEPTLADVLNCLGSDIAGVENARSFRDWCGDLGYDPDSRKVEKIYIACVKQKDDMLEFLDAGHIEHDAGRAALNELMFETSEDGDDDEVSA